MGVPTRETTAGPLASGGGGSAAQATSGPLSADQAGAVDIFFTGWNAEVRQVEDGWTISFSASFQAIGGPTPQFGISYAVCDRFAWCGREMPHEFGEDLIFGEDPFARSGQSTVQTVAPLAEFEERSIGGPAVESWRGEDPRGKFFLARFDSTETVSEAREDNNLILILIPPP